MMRGLVARAGFLLALCNGAARAQPSPYVPLDDPLYVYVDALQARGYLRSLPLLDRPYTVNAIRRAMAADADRAQPARVQAWMRTLGRSASRWSTPLTGDSAAGVSYVVAGGLRGVAQTSGQRELMLADTLSGAFPGATLRGVLSASRVTAAARMMADNRLRDDPDFAGKKDRFVRGRMEDAYASGQWPLGELFFGRLSRNWGPPTHPGLHLGSTPYSFDHLYGRLGVERLHLATLLARLENTPSQRPSDLTTPSRAPTGPAAQRYLALHRLAASFRGLEAAISESYLYSGVGRGLSFTLSNPFILYDLAQYNESETGNVAYSLDLAWRSRGPWVGAQFFLDDLQVDDCAVACDEPSSWAATLTVGGLPVGELHRLFATYTRVTSLVYRTPDPTERYASFGVGLGRGFTDYDEWQAGIDAAVWDHAPLRFVVAFRRQGSGDYRRPFPLPAEYASTPGFLIGPVLRVVRFGMQGGMTAGDLAASWDLGFNRRSGRADGSGLEGRFILRWEPEFGILRGATH